MKKTVLRKLKPLLVTERIKKMVREDVGETKASVYGYMSYNKSKIVSRVYNYSRYYRAEQEEGILKIAVFTRNSIARGQKEPIFTIFIDSKTEEWITYETETGRWLTAMIFNLPYEYDSGEYYQCYGWCSEKETKLINDYLGTQGEVKKSIREYQTNKKQDILQKKHKSEIEQIDEFMEEVPELPKDFDKWILGSGYNNNQYIIMKPGKIKEGYCTKCKKMVPIKVKPKHNDTGICQRCKLEITYKSFGRQQIIEDEKNVGIMQRLKDKSGYVLRIFETKQFYHREDDYSYQSGQVGEIYRFRLDEYFHVRETFVWDEYRYTGVVRWCHEQKRFHGYGYYARTSSTYCALYEKNIDDLLKDTDGKYVPLKRVIRSKLGYCYHADDLFRTAVEHPQIEKLIKLNLNKISLELLTREANDDRLSLRSDKVWDMLKVNKEYMRLAIKMDANMRELSIMQAAYLDKISINERIIKSIDEFFPCLNRDDLMIFLRHGKIEKTFNYLNKLKNSTDNRSETVGRDYRDYLNQLQRLGMVMDNSNRFPSDFYQAHARLSEVIREKEDAIKKLEIRKKNKILKNIVEKLKKLYFAESDEFEIVWPMKKEDFTKEGQLQHNCVGGYFEKVISERTVVFFLRKKKNKNTPFCTVEFTNGRLIQCRTINNGNAPEEAMDYMKLIEKNYAKALKKLEKQQKEQVRVAV